MRYLHCLILWGCKITKNKNKRQESACDYTVLFHYKTIIVRKIIAKVIRFEHSLLKALYPVPAIRFCSREIVMQSEFCHLTRSALVADLTP